MYKVSSVTEATNEYSSLVQIQISKKSIPFDEHVGVIMISVNKKDHELTKGFETMVKRHLTKINKEK